MDISKVVAVGIVGAILSLTLKKTSPEFSILIAIITGILIFMFVTNSILQVINLLKAMAETANVNITYLKIILKAISIAYISEFGVQICIDAGEKTIASKIELAGKILIMLVSAPIILALMDLVLNMTV